MHYLTNLIFCCNEGSFIKDHIDIHRALGVEHFVIYDRSYIPPYPRDIFSGVSDVEVLTYPTDKYHLISHCYRDGMIYLQGKTKWCAVNDVDEVFCPTKVDDLRVMLQEYERYSAVSFNWKMFGSSWHEKEPNQCPYLSFTKRANNNFNPNQHVKSIVQVSDVSIGKRWRSSHHPPLEAPRFQVNEKFRYINGPFNEDVSYDVCAVYHYFTRSREAWAQKTDRINADTGGAPAYTEQQFDDYNRECNEIDDFRVRDLWNKLVGNK
jgi:hypothetical protein